MKRRLRKLWRRRLIAVGLVILVVLIGTALLAPYLAPFDPTRQVLKEGLAKPGGEHILGQDRFGRDVFSRIIYGARISLWVGLSTSLVSLFLGTAIGSTSAYIGGLLDDVVVRIMDILMAFPGILLALAVMAVLGPSLNNVILALCLTGWVGYARLARGQTLAVRRRDFITAAKALGAGKARIILVHVLPNIMAPLIVQATFGMGTSIVGEAGLSFLGFGVQPPTPSWGSMLNEGRQYLLLAPHLTTFPGLAIMLVVLGFNFLGDGLRDALDPKLQG